MSSIDLNALYVHHLQTLCQRADEALVRCECDHLLIPSGSNRFHAFDDQTYPYATNPYFKQWLPLTDVPDSWLIYTPGQRPRLIYLQPHDYWNVVPKMPEGWWVDEIDIHIIREARQAFSAFPKGQARCAIIGELNGFSGQSFLSINPSAALAYLTYHRAFKTDYELALMRQAQHIAVAGHRAAEQAFRAGYSEFDIHLDYCRQTRQDATQTPYPNIVALNAHGAVLHYTDLEHVAPSVSRSFLIDAGASYCGYASDITRTYASDESGEFAHLITAVEHVQIELGYGVRAGKDYLQLHLEAHLALARVLKNAGLLKTSPETAVETGISATFFPHGIGHLLGLQVHDTGGFAISDRGKNQAPPDAHPYLRLTRALAPGMVVTIEPGLYFIDKLLTELRQTRHAADVDWTCVEQFRPYGGIRIEDNVLCTSDGPENLTRNAFSAAV